MDAAPGSKRAAQLLGNAPASDSGIAFHPSRVLVRFRPGASRVARAAARSNVNGQAETALKSVADLEVIIVPTGRVHESIEALKRNPAVVYAEPDYMVHAYATPTDPRFTELWGLQNLGQIVAGRSGTPGADVNVTPLWDVWTGDPDFRIAVIDTGVNYRHPDLAGNVWTNPGEIPANGVDDDGNGWIDDVHGYDFINGDGDPIDDHGHGSHVSGTIGSVANNGIGVVGINWQVKIVGLKFLSADGTGPTSAAIQAIDYCIANNIRLSNNSWGGGGPSQALYDAIQAADAARHLFVAAAGNSSSNVDLFPEYPAAFDLPNIVSVAATDQNDQLASFSNYGAITVDLGAPGVAVLSTVLNEDYAYFNGTSMASPHVTGVAGLILSRVPSLTPADVKARLLDTVRPVPALAGKTLTGGGVDAFDAFGDCNANGLLDSDEIANGTAADCSGNGVPDECEPDCNGNGTADSCDIFDGVLADCNSDGIPDTCQGDCNGNGTPDVCEIIGGFVRDCDRDNVPDACELAAGAPDCNGNGELDACELAAGTSTDCDLNEILDECELGDNDCNSNGVPDWCDIGGAGGSHDCDQNFVPDECQTTPDCNNNGIADNIDLCFAHSFDCNHNGRPDECDVDTADWQDCNQNGVLDHCEFGLIVLVPGDPNGSGINPERFSGVSPPSPFLAGLEEFGFIVDLHNRSHPLDRPTDVRIRHSTTVSPLERIDERVFAGELGLVYLDNWPPANGFVARTSSFPSSPIAPWPPDPQFLHNGGPRFRKGARIIDKASPLAQGLSMESGLEGFSMMPHLKAGVNTVAVWSDGTPLAATHRYGAGRVAYVNDLSGWTGTGLWPGDVEFGKQLIANAILYAAPTTKDCNLNQVLDECEIRDGLSIDDLPAGGDGIPDECQSDCNGNGLPDRSEVDGALAADCDNNGVPDDCTFLLRDCNVNGVPDACDIASGTSTDCLVEWLLVMAAANGVPDDCEPDCDANGVPDFCDLAADPFQDCDHDYVLDRCEADLDGNGRADVCENGVNVLWSGSVGPFDLHQGLLSPFAGTVYKVPLPDSPNWPQDLSFYDLIVLTGRGVPSDPARHAQIDEAVANGAGLVIFLADRGQRGDTVFEGNSSPYSAIGGIDHAYRTGEVVAPGNPVANGLPPRSSMIAFTVPAFLRSEATAVVNWSDPLFPPGRPMVATMRYGAGRVVWLNILGAEAWPELFFDDRFFGMHLLKNAFSFALGALVADCNENGADDELDIANLTSFDCDGGGIPDECQIPRSSTAPNGPFFCDAGCDPDCNESGVPDACELLNNDRNGNGIPDECDLAGHAIPAISTWGLVVTALLLLAAGTVGVRSKKTPCRNLRACSPGSSIRPARSFRRHRGRRQRCGLR